MDYVGESVSILFRFTQVFIALLHPTFKIAIKTSDVVKFSSTSNLIARYADQDITTKMKYTRFLLYCKEGPTVAYLKEAQSPRLEKEDRIKKEVISAAYTRINRLQN